MPTKMTENQIKELKEIIEAVKNYMSAPDIADEFGYKSEAVRRVARIMGVELLSCKQVRVNYLREMSERKTINQLVKILDLHPTHLRALAKENFIELHHTLPDNSQEIPIIIRERPRTVSLAALTTKATYNEKLLELLQQER